MINTGTKGVTEGLLSNNTLTIIDDVNSENIDSVKITLSSCDKAINTKFDMPTSNNEIITKRSKSISKIYEILTEMNNELINKKSQHFSSETQFKNFKIKILFWATNTFEKVLDLLDNNGTAIVVVSNNNISKHELMFMDILNKLGTKVLIISNKNECENILKNNPNLVVKRYNTSENISISQYFGNNTQTKLNSTMEKSNIENNNNMHGIGYRIMQREQQEEILNRFKTIADIETAIYDNKEKFKIIVSGTAIYVDTCDFYGKIYNECQTNPEFVLYTNGFHRPTYEETKAFPRLKIDRHSYIMETCLKFVNIKNESLKGELLNAIRIVFNERDYKGLSPEILSNKILYTICIINNLINNEDIKYIAYYGNVSSSDKLVFNVLSNMDSLSYIILTSDKSKAEKLSNTSFVDLPNSVELFPIPTLDSRNNASTMAAQAERRVNQTLYSGDTLGMYKPGQFRLCETKRFTTTFDEIILWWNKEMYIRPNFEAQGDLAVIPTMFKVIKGVAPNTPGYVNYIQKLACGKTILIKDVRQIKMMSNFYESCNRDSNFNGHFFNKLTDIHKTKFNDQKPFYEYNKLNKNRIFSSINYRYGFLNRNKQELIINKIEEIINSGYINESRYANRDAFIDTVLNLLLNLNIDILQYIQWFEFYTYNPNVILILNDTEMPSANDMIIITFLSLMGFDVLIFIPTAYSGIENHITNKFSYDTHLIGEAIYNVDFSSIKVTSNIEVIQDDAKKKQSFLSRFFNK